MSVNRVQPENLFEPFFDYSDIVRLGQTTPYSRIDEVDDINAFREFLAYVQANASRFTQTEVQAAALADKPFTDGRISDKARRILGHAYKKAYQQPWQFNFVRGLQHKYRGQIAWTWADGTED
jgi:hypothetical protein